MRCPNCNAPEINMATGLLFIRAFKILIDNMWEHHCLHCGVWFNDNGVTEVCADTCYCKEVDHAAQM